MKIKQGREMVALMLIQPDNTFGSKREIITFFSDDKRVAHKEAESIGRQLSDQSKIVGYSVV